MLNTDFLVIKHKDSLWNNFMIYTSFEFQDKWTKLENWNEFSNFRTKTFLDELVIECNDISRQLVISLHRWSTKYNIQYLTKKIDKILNKNENTKSIFIDSINKKNIITSSCFTPPESNYLNEWKNATKIKDLDDLVDKKKENIYNYNNINYDDTLIFAIEV